MNGLSDAAGALEGVPRYEHIFVLVEENDGPAAIIGNPNAPNINRLAKQYGNATGFYAEVHPSEGNYVAMLGGDTFGIHDNDAYYCMPNDSRPGCGRSRTRHYVDHTINAPSLMSQLEDAHLTWKGYFEGIPTNVLAQADKRSNPPALYVTRHNGFVNFKSVQADAHVASHLVSFERMKADLDQGTAPNFAVIVANLCNDMHGVYPSHFPDAPARVPPDCFITNPQGVIRRGDRSVGEIVGRIQKAALWRAAGNVAIVLTWDEGDESDMRGCCGSNPNDPGNSGGGRVVTLVITNHGPRAMVDATPYNHYSMLRTIEDAFGISEHPRRAGDSAAGVKPMAPLFAVGR